MTSFWVDFGTDGELQILEMPFCALFRFSNAMGRAFGSRDVLNTV